MQTATPPERDPFRVPEELPQSRTSGLPQSAEVPRRPTSKGSGPQKSGKGAKGAGSWAAQAEAWAQLAAQAAALAAAVPAGEPSPAQAKAIRAATTTLSQHTGAVKKALGIGAPKQ